MKLQFLAAILTFLLAVTPAYAKDVYRSSSTHPFGASHNNYNGKATSYGASQHNYNGTVTYANPKDYTTQAPSDYTTTHQALSSSAAY